MVEVRCSQACLNFFDWALRITRTDIRLSYVFVYGKHSFVEYESCKLKINFPFVEYF